MARPSRCSRHPEAPACNARAPAEKCALAEAGDKEIVFSAFDPAAGRGNVLLKAPNSGWDDIFFWALSPDGRRIAVSDPLLLGNRIRIFDLAGGPARELTVAEMSWCVSLSWAVDGQGLFASGWGPDGVLVLIDLEGRETLLLRSRNDINTPLQSPDGKHLAFRESISHSNAWLIENF